MKSKLVDNVEKYVKKQIEIYKEVSLDHYDFWEEHVKYVYDESLLLADFYGADKEIVALIAIPVPNEKSDTKSFDTEDEANTAKRFRDSKVGSAAINVFKALTNPVKWYDYINNGNIDQDLQRLEDNLDDMLNNKLFYLSAKLQARR